MDREKARKAVLLAIHKERDWQAARISERQDDTQVGTDLLFLVGVLSKYQGQVACEGVEQSQAREVDWERVARACIKQAAVAVAVAESLVASGKVPTSIFRTENMHS
jgi:hypothetical protein